MNAISSGFEVTSIFGLSDAEIDLVAGGDALSNLLGSIATLTVAVPAVAAYNAVATTVNSEIGSLASGNLCATVLGSLTAVLAGANKGITTATHALAYVSQGSTGFSTLMSALGSAAGQSISNVLSRASKVPFTR